MTEKDHPQIGGLRPFDINKIIQSDDPATRKAVAYGIRETRRAMELERDLNGSNTQHQEIPPKK